jgi:hypothetical protein
VITKCYLACFQIAAFLCGCGGAVEQTPSTGSNENGSADDRVAAPEASAPSSDPNPTEAKPATKSEKPSCPFVRAVTAPGPQGEPTSFDRMCRSLWSEYSRYSGYCGQSSFNERTCEILSVKAGDLQIMRFRFACWETLFLVEKTKQGWKVVDDLGTNEETISGWSNFSMRPIGILRQLAGSEPIVRVEHTVEYRETGPDEGLLLNKETFFTYCDLRPAAGGRRPCAISFPVLMEEKIYSCSTPAEDGTCPGAADSPSSVRRAEIKVAISDDGVVVPTLVFGRWSRDGLEPETVAPERGVSGDSSKGDDWVKVEANDVTDLCSETDLRLGVRSR